MACSLPIARAWRPAGSNSSPDAPWNGSRVGSQAAIVATLAQPQTTMSATPAAPSSSPDGVGRSTASPEQDALEKALGRLMDAVARLAVARGLPFAVAEDMLKSAFIHSAAAANPGVPAHRNVSRISTATGISRREVTRLTQPGRRGEPGQPERMPRSVASEVFAHWRTQAPYRDAKGEPLTLPRQGAAPSFESLAQAVTRDVHPRSLLDELCRLGLAQIDATADTVTLLRDAYVPHGDRVRMMGFLGENVGDHLSGAVDNVLAGDRMHFEQALFADGLSAASIASVRPAVAAHWQALLAAMVPQLETLVDADKQAQAAPPHRLRLGLYTYYEAQPQEHVSQAQPTTKTDNPAEPPNGKPGTPGKPGKSGQPDQPSKRRSGAVKK